MVALPRTRSPRRHWSARTNRTSASLRALMMRVPIHRLPLHHQIHPYRPILLCHPILLHYPNRATLTPQY